MLTLIQLINGTTLSTFVRMKLFGFSFISIWQSHTCSEFLLSRSVRNAFKKSFLNSHHVNTWCAECRRRMYFLFVFFFGWKKDDPSTYRWCCIYIVWAFIVEYLLVSSFDKCMINHRHNGDWHICSHHIRIGHTKEQHKRHKVPGTKHFYERKIKEERIFFINWMKCDKRNGTYVDNI